jgi:RNA polymerase sigma-70 factor (ECF subfamily)
LSKAQTQSIGSDDGFAAREETHLPRYAGLVRQHLRAVLAICLARAGNLHDAEDLSQEVFLKAFRKIASLRDQAKTRSWLFQIARRVCADHHRCFRRASPLPEDLADTTEADDPRLDRLDAALSELASDDREPLVLYYLGGEDCRQVASDLGISESAARQRLFRARAKLQAILTTDEP